MQPPTGTKDPAIKDVAASDSAVTRQMPPVAVGDANTLPPAPTIASPVGEACAKCGAIVAADQRYCIECGERRGDPRLPFMDGRTAAQPPAEVLPAPPYPLAYPPPAAPKGKWSSGLALLSTIAVLLLAMGVGVLIGNNGDDSKASAQQPLIIGGGATAGTGASAATGASDATASAATGENGETTSGVDANALAKKNGVKLAPKDVDLGGKCPKGSVGCNDSGEFDGEYFK